jgi:hypothetical protein
MHFVQTAFLGALAAIAVPVIVHLLFRSRARRVHLGTLRFLRQVLERNAQRQRIMRWLLLAMRMLVVGLLAMLFARPYLVAAGLGGQSKLLVVLIDASATMDLKEEGTRLIDRALREARELVASQPARTRVEVALFDHSVRPLSAKPTNESGDAQGTTRADALAELTSLATPAASYRGTDYGAAIAWARDIGVRSGMPERELHVYTDFQRSGLDWSEVDPLPADMKVRLHDLGRAVVNNVAVTEARGLRTVVRPGEGTTILVTLLNGGEFPVADQEVHLKLESKGGGRIRLKERTKLEPGSTASVKFETGALAEGLWTGTVSVTVEDDLAFDNARQVAILSTKPWRTLVLDGQPKRVPVLAESYFLATALRLAGEDEQYSDAPFEAVVREFPRGAPLPPVDDARVVVLANVPEVARSTAGRLETFVKEGGGLVVFGGDEVTRAGMTELAKVGLVPGEVEGPVLSTDLPFRIDDWDARSPLMSPFNDPQHGDLRRLAFRGYTRLIVPGDDPSRERAVAPPPEEPRVIARLRDGAPLLVEKRVGMGSVVWCGLAADRAWGEWTASKLYVPLIHRIVGQPLRLNDGGPVRGVNLDGVANLPPETVPGVFDNKAYWSVVNAGPRESETERCTEEEFARRFGIRLSEDQEEVAASSLPVRDELRQDEQWHWIALVLVGLLCAETWVANRTVS